MVVMVMMMMVVVVLVMSGWHMATLTRLRLQETRAGAKLLADAIFQRVNAVVKEAGETNTDPYDALRADGGLRSILEASIGYSQNVLYAAVVAPDGHGIGYVAGPLGMFRIQRKP